MILSTSGDRSGTYGTAISENYSGSFLSRSRSHDNVLTGHTRSSENIFFFPDANLRTAIATLRRLMRRNDIYPPAWPSDRLRNVRQDSHRIRSEVGPVRLNTLYRRDRLHDRWYTFFTTVTLSADVG